MLGASATRLGHRHEPPLPIKPPGLHLVPQAPELGITPPRVPESAQQWTGTAVDAGLRRRIGGHLLARVRLLANRPDRRPLRDWNVSPAGTTREQRLDGCREESGLGPEDPVHGLDDTPASVAISASGTT